jgi:hypothetical protein
MHPKRYLFGIVFSLLIFNLQSLQAHVVDAKGSTLSEPDAALLYLKLGFTHILPMGADHMLFVVSLFLLNPKLKSVIAQTAVFTLAHSITLGLAMYGIVSPPATLVEPLIALSIFFVAVENIITDQLKPARIAVVFFFGLLHGLGFAGALSELGLPHEQLFTSLLLFNVGVELGQITILLLAWLLIGKWLTQKTGYRKRFLIPFSALVAIIALYWTIQRSFFPL